MQLLLNEVLQKVSNAKTKAQKIKLLQQYNNPALRSVLIANFDESVISMLPDGDVPYKPNDAPEETEHTRLIQEYRIVVKVLFSVLWFLRCLLFVALHLVTIA